MMPESDVDSGEEWPDASSAAALAAITVPTSTHLASACQLLSLLAACAAIMQARQKDASKRGVCCAALSILCAVGSSVAQIPISASNHDLLLLMSAVLGVSMIVGACLAAFLHQRTAAALMALTLAMAATGAVLIAWTSRSISANTDNAEDVSMNSQPAFMWLLVTSCICGVGGVLMAMQLLRRSSSAGRMAHRPIVSMLLILATLIGTCWMVVARMPLNTPNVLVLLLAPTLLALYVGTSAVSTATVISILVTCLGLSMLSLAWMIQSRFLLVGSGIIASAATAVTTKLCMEKSSSVASGSTSTGAWPRSVSIRRIQVEGASTLIEQASSIAIVPGHGMVASKSTVALGLIAELLQRWGKHVHFCIHPLAGRGPGLVRSLLLESGIPPSQLFDVDDPRMPHFRNVDVSLVVGASDIVNPLTSAGMPVCEVWHSRHVLVFKRSLGTGFAGIENDLFHYPNTSMLLGDASTTLNQLHAQLLQQDEAMTHRRQLLQPQQERQDDTTSAIKWTTGDEGEAEDPTATHITSTGDTEKKSLSNIHPAATNGHRRATTFSAVAAPLETQPLLHHPQRPSRSYESAELSSLHDDATRSHHRTAYRWSSVLAWLLLFAAIVLVVALVLLVPTEFEWDIVLLMLACVAGAAMVRSMHHHMQHATICVISALCGWMLRTMALSCISMHEAGATSKAPFNMALVGMGLLSVHVGSSLCIGWRCTNGLAPFCSSPSLDDVRWNGGGAASTLSVNGASSTNDMV